MTTTGIINGFKSKIILHHGNNISPEIVFILAHFQWGREAANMKKGKPQIEEIHDRQIFHQQVEQMKSYNSKHPPVDPPTPCSS